MLLSYLLFATIILSFLDFFLIRKINLPGRISTAFQFAVLYILLHCTYGFFIEVFVEKSLLRSWLAPFILLYGPLFYHGLNAVCDKKPVFSSLLLQALPFLLFGCWFLGIGTGVFGRGEVSQVEYGKALYLTCAVSFIVYGFASLPVERQILRAKIKYNVLVFSAGRIVLVFLGACMLGISLFYFEQTALDSLKLVAFFCLLVLSLLIYYSVVRQLKAVGVTNNSAPTKIPLKNAITDKYGKSQLTQEQLAHYEQRLNIAVLKEKLFLKQDLSLSNLALHLKMPNHHLTQLLSRTTNQTFHEFINKHRVEHACALLEKSPGIALDAVAEQSGFNSKPSFNRQFKTIVGKSPSEYRNQYQ